MSTTPVATITVATDQISPMATIEITLVAAVCSFVVVDLSLIYRYTPNLNLCTIHISWALVWLHRSVHHQAGGVSAFENVWFQQ
jgi:hypothetical protein